MFVLRFIARFAVNAAVFALFFAAILAAILLLAAGLLAVPVSVIVMSGLFTAVASDLSPLAMLFAGISCLSAGLALSLGIVILFPRQVRLCPCRGTPSPKPPA